MMEQAVRIKSIHQEEFMSIPGNEGRIAQVWANVRGGMRKFAAYFWHTDGWSRRNEAILEVVLKEPEPQSIQRISRRAFGFKKIKCM